MKKMNIFFKNFVAGHRALIKRVLVYGGSAIATYQFISMLINEKTIQNLISQNHIYNLYIHPLLNNLLFYLGVAVILALFAQGGFSKYSKKIDDSNIIISIVVGDIFSCDGDIVVPCNNIFAYDDDIIGDRSIQYQLNQRCSVKNKKGSEIIGEQIRATLETAEFQKEELVMCQQEIGGVTYKKYKYGLMLPINVKINRKKRRFYLLSMSEIVSKGKPAVNNSTLLESINSMWEYIKINKISGDTLVVPVMGTGAAKMVEKPKQVIARYILKTFADSAKDELGIKKLILCVYSGDYLNDEIDVEELREYTDYLCKFPNSEFKVD